MQYLEVKRRARHMKNSCRSNLEDEPKWKLVFVHFILACTRCGERRLTPSCRILQNLEFGKLHLDSLWEKMNFGTSSMKMHKKNMFSTTNWLTSIFRYYSFPFCNCCDMQMLYKRVIWRSTDCVGSISYLHTDFLTDVFSLDTLVEGKSVNFYFEFVCQPQYKTVCRLPNISLSYIMNQ